MTNEDIKRAEALSNLTVWTAVKKMMESSLFYGGHCQKAEQRIVQIAEREIQKEFNRYNR
jgi:hypothetical protein